MIYIFYDIIIFYTYFYILEYIIDVQIEHRVLKIL